MLIEQNLRAQKQRRRANEEPAVGVAVALLIASALK